VATVAFEQDDERLHTEQVAVRAVAASEPPTPEPLSTEPAWTLERLEQLALDQHPGVAQAVAQLESLQGKWWQAGLPPNPSIGYQAAEVGNEGNAGQQGAFVAQDFIRGGKLQLSRQVVTQEIAVAEQRLAELQQRVLTDVRIGFYDVLIAQRQLELARELVRVSDNAVTASRDLLRIKEIPEIGLKQTEVEAQTARIVERRAENEQKAAWRRLSSVLGRPGWQPQSLEGTLEPANIDLQFDEQLARLVAESPEVAAAVFDVERSRWALQRACAEVTPDVNAQIVLQHDNTTRDTVTGIQVGLPLPLWNRNQGGILEAQSQIIAAERNMERVALDLRRRLADAFQTYDDTRFQVEQYSQQILPTARETFDLVTQGYQQGEIGYLDMLTAQRTYFQTNLSYIEALRELWRATLRIEGLLLDESLADSGG
jgi:outer membrane protein, heavy metal efflux system